MGVKTGLGRRDGEFDHESGNDMHQILMALSVKCLLL